MQNTQVNRKYVASINLTNAVPKRVLLISSTLKKFYQVEQICWKRYETGNVNDAVNIDALSFSSYLIKLTKILIKKRYSLILFDDLRLLPFVVIIGKISGALLVYNRQEVPTVNASSSLTEITRIPYRFTKGLAEFVEFFFAKGVDAVLTVPVNDREKRRIKYWKKPIATIHNFPDTSSFRIIKSYPHDLSNHIPTLIYSGSVSRENGLFKYLRLVQYLERNNFPIKLILIGRLWNMSTKELISLIHTESCTHSVEYREWVPYEELMKIIKNADAGIALTDPTFEKYKHLSEGASRKIYTYMAAGLPIIAGGAFGHIVQQEHAGFFIEYDDFNSLVESTRELLSNPEKAQRMGEFGRKAVLRKYNWESQQYKIEKIIYKLTR